MKRLTLTLLLLMASVPAFAGYTVTYTLTYDHTQVGTADSTNYPVLLSATKTNLKTVGNGGNVTNSSGFDIVVTSDLGCTTIVNFDRLLYVGSTGQIILFFNVATLSHTANGTLYLCAGNSAVTTDQANPTSLWSNAGGVGFSAVRHLQENGAPYADATGNGFGSNGATAPTQVAGLFGFAQSFVGASSQFISFPVSVSTGITLWLSGWFRTPSASLPANSEIVTLDTRGTIPSGLGQLGCVNYLDVSGHVNGYCNASTTVAGSTNLADGNWHFYVLIADGSNNFSIYVDAAFVASHTGGVTSFHSGNEFAGKSSDASPVFTTGISQEIRTHNTTFSTSWMTADYNSQKPSSTFLTIGVPVVSAPAMPPAVY